MSNLSPSDPSRNHPDNTQLASNNKVIVLSMKNMPSFKFDTSKNFLAPSTTSESGQSIFSFKPQQLIQPATAAQIITSSQQKVQVAPSAVPKIGSPGTILIRAQPSSAVNKSQFAPFANCPNVKVQEAPGREPPNVNKEVSSSTSGPQTIFRNKVTSEITVKPQVVQSLLLQSSSILKNQAVFTSPVQIPSGIKGISVSQAVSPPGQVHRVVVASKEPKISAKMSKPIPIRPKLDTSKVIIQQQQILVSPPPQLKQTAMPMSPGAPITARFNAVTQKWTGVPALYQQPVPALTPIQPKLVSIVQPRPIIEQEDEKFEEEVISEVVEKTLGKPQRTTEEEQRLLEVKRIIEGDVEELSQDSESREPMEEYEVVDDESKNSESSGEESTEPSAALLLCDERIESVSTETSPLESEKSKDTAGTPKESESESQKVEARPSLLDVRKNLSRELSFECDKENVEIIVGEESDSDESSMVESQRDKMLDYEDSLAKSEIIKSGVEQVTPTVTVAPTRKAKRVRKPKNPTIIATLGLPYKPSQPSTRKTKVEKKLEFELDFHDPLNKIQWDDGIGGLNNCNKLFGFDEFGLIEVINKKDAIAKLKHLDVKVDSKEDSEKYKLRKIVDPADQFVCSVCSKLGTIRDFFSPECCSESCMGITKRKASELSIPAGKESSPESEILTPVDERKMMFGGEMIPLQQLQQHLLEQELPPAKRKRSRKQVFKSAQESKFMWDTYLSAKSVPAAIELFKKPFPRMPNPFKVGMKLEAIDPENQKLFCVCTVEEKLGYRMKLHFDGYSPAYDFWVNADSPNIFQSGFCHSSHRVLQTPPKWSSKKFDWSEYLDHTNSTGTQRSLFPHLVNRGIESPFEQGMKLEVMRDGKLYAASIIDILDDRVLVSHDGHEELGCIWLDIYSPYLHPCDYHKTIADPESFIPPSRPFNWKDYLKDTASKEAPAEFLFFRKRSAFEFVPGLKLEVVDKVNRQLIRPATILCRNEHKIQVIFDGFDISFAYWLDDDSEDIHPINWCEKTGHPIEHPAGFNKSFDNGLCPSPGCRGIGNGSHPDRYFHDNSKECPYNKSNWKRLLNKRLGSHTDSKSATKRSAKSNNKDFVSNGSRNMSGNFAIKDVRDVKDEVQVVEENSMDVQEAESSEVEKGSKKRGRKRKPATVKVEDTENEPETQPQPSKIAKTFIEDYGPTLNYSYQLWKKNSKILDRASIGGEVTGNPIEWNTQAVCAFIERITEDSQTAAKFEEQAIDGHAFVLLSQDDIMSLLNIKMGTAVKIYNRILHMREEIVQKFIKL